ncbi:MAG TPA: hypothetical protein VH438_15015, partial [Gemmatimonadales bacterium]
ATAWKRRFVIAALLAGFATVATVLAWLRKENPSGSGPSWSYVTFGDSIPIATGQRGLAYSPDGSLIAVKSSAQNGRLWLKRRGELNPTPIPGTERATTPVFSPDGEWLAFWRDGQIKKVRVEGGGAVTLADSAYAPALTWLDDGTVVYAEGGQTRLRRIPGSGGPSTVVLDDSTLYGLASGAYGALPRARGILFNTCTAGCATMTLRVLDLKTHKQQPLIEDAAQGWYLPTGQLLYVRRDGTAMVSGFDLERLQLKGVAVPVLEEVLVGVGFAQLAWSHSGSLVYIRGEGLSLDQVLIRASRNGVAAPLDTGLVGQFNSLAISPDGRRIAVGVGGTVGALNIWVRSLDRGPATRLSFGGQDRRPAWSPDGKLVAFIRDTGSSSIVVARPADGSGSERRIAKLDRMIQEIAWSPDGRWLVLRTDNGATGAGDLVGVRTSGDTTPVSLVASPYTELHPAVSPDGHWLAYVSDESGQNEVYVRPFPNTDAGRWQVSTGGGVEPRWSGDSREIFFIDSNDALVAAHLGPGPTFSVVETRRLFDTSGYIGQTFHQSYDVTPDGRFFLFVGPRLPRTGAGGPQVVQVDNWFEDLKAKVRQ